jgi:hypothetical protein
MKEYKYKLLLIGDFNYFLNDRYFMNSCIIIWGILALISQLLHYWKYYKKVHHIWNHLKWFLVWYHQKSIGLINREDVIHLLKKSKLTFEISRKIVISMSFVDFGLSLIWFRINSSFSLYSIHIFGSLLLLALGYFATNITFSQMTYFYIICLYLKLKLRNANNRFHKNFEKKYKMSNYRMKNILILLNSIISEINFYNNDCRLNIYCSPISIIVMDLALFQSIFGKMTFFFKFRVRLRLSAVVKILWNSIH